MAKQLQSKPAGPEWKCPACSQELRVEESSPGLYLFCGWFKCPYLELNDGAYGLNLQEAFTKLESIYERKHGTS